MAPTKSSVSYSCDCPAILGSNIIAVISPPNSECASCRFIQKFVLKPLLAYIVIWLLSYASLRCFFFKKKKSLFIISFGHITNQKNNFAASSGHISFRSYAVRNKEMPSISTTFQQAFPLQPSAPSAKQKKQNVPCYQRQEAPQIEAKSMEEVYDSLAEHLVSVVKNLEHADSKYIVGLAGPPGAGKSTVASEVVRRVNMLWSLKHAKDTVLLPGEEIAAMLPMDGFHLYRSQLDAMEDPKEAHARRGAPWTFNPSLLLKCLETLRTEGSVNAPSFDHGVGDPVENDIFVKPQHKIVIVEGNYILMEQDVWREIRDFFDEKWFIDIDIDVSMQRVLKRHIATGKEPDVAAWRISYNDRPNAELIMESRKNADLVIRSVDFSS